MATLHEINIMRYTPQYEAAVLALFRSNIPQYFAPEEENELAEYLRHRAHHHYLITNTENEILASGGFEVRGNSGIIAWDFVHPQQQRKGLGKLLLNFRLNKLQQYPNVQIVRVRTSQFAFEFYQKSGFILQNIQKDYWAKGFDLYDMEKLFS